MLTFSGVYTGIEGVLCTLCLPLNNFCEGILIRQFPYSGVVIQNFYNLLVANGILLFLPQDHTGVIL